MSDRIYERLEIVFRDNFPDHDQGFSPDLRTEDVAGWDSTAHVGFMIALEDEFHVQFTDDDYVAFKTIGELKSLIDRRSG